MNNKHLNSQGHDESEYLPHGTPPVNAYRAAKGDIKRFGEEIRARHWMPDLLYDRNKLSKENVDTCLSFYSILIGARRTLGICDIMHAITNRMAQEAANKDVDAFLEIMRGLTRPQMNMLIWVVDNDRNHENIPLAFHLLGTITAAVEKAQQILFDIKQAREDNNKIHVTPIAPEISTRST